MALAWAADSAGCLFVKKLQGRRIRTGMSIFLFLSGFHVVLCQNMRTE